MSLAKRSIEDFLFIYINRVKVIAQAVLLVAAVFLFPSSAGSYTNAPCSDKSGAADSGGLQKADRSRQAFAESMSRESGIPEGVILAWARVEGGNGNNFLNIGCPGIDLSSPLSAGRDSARWLRGDGPCPAPPSVQKITRSEKRYFRAIAASGWSLQSNYLEMLRAAWRQ